MSRHRQVRSNYVDYSEDYKGYNDVYGYSDEEDDSCICPIEARFLYDRNCRHLQMSAFLGDKFGIGQDDEIRNPSEYFKQPVLSDLQEAQLKSCVDEIQNVVGDKVPQDVIEETVLDSNFNFKMSLDCILEQSSVKAKLKDDNFVQPRLEALIVLDGIDRIKEKKIDVESQYKKIRKDSKDLIHMVVVGHVDAGKSSLMGHILYVLGRVSDRTIHKYQRESIKMGKRSFHYAWVLDEIGEERSRGITMDVGHSKFETKTKIVYLLDAPGHKDFIPNMIIGATQADVAVLVIDAAVGEFETGFEKGGQTREHTLLVRSLGVDQLAVVINKLDVVGWSEKRFNEIVSNLSPFLKKSGFKESEIIYVPCSGLLGENLTEQAKEPRLTQWYNGPCLMDVIDNFKAPQRPISKPLRISVNDAFKGTGTEFCLSAHIITGMVQRGDVVRIQPSKDFTTVRAISIDNTAIRKAFAGDRVNLTLSNYNIENITSGVILCDRRYCVPTATKFEARIILFNVTTPIIVGYPIVLHLLSLSEPAVIVKLVAHIEKNSGEVIKKRPRYILKNSHAILEIETSRAICIELYRNVKELGRFLLRVSGVTIAAGLVTKIF